MEQTHYPKEVRTYTIGANRDVSPENFESIEGQYYDATNMRTIPMDGDNATAKKISGEEILYPNIDNRCTVGTGDPLALTYECIGVSEINGNIIEFWADAAQNYPSLIRVNGKIVLMSEDFPIQVNYPLQIAKNEACIGGEIYITDYNVPPMIFNIKDLLLNSGINVGGETGQCTQKYFDDFNIQEHLLILTRVLDHPVFIKLDTSISGYDEVFGSGGAPVGYNAYSFRYVTTDGERTAFSASTPQIPVMKTLSASCPNYPYLKTITKDPDISVPSQYGIHIRFRVNNEANYDFIEIRRDRWNAGDPIGSPAISEIIGSVDIVNGQFDILDVLDIGAEAEETLSGDDVTSVMSAINRVKAIRYFNQVLYLFNVEYASRDITNDVSFIDEGNPDVIFPAIENIGKAGHNDPWSATYYKSQMRGEKRGFGVVAWDQQGQWSYAKKINGADNYAFPNRREPTSALTEGVSYFGTVDAANINGSVARTHEVFDLEEATAKTNKCLYVNIMKDKGRKFQTKVNIDGCTPAQDEDLTDAAGFVTVDKLGYRPFTPVSQDDPTCSHLNYMVNYEVSNDAIGNWIDYEPQGFEPRYFSMGACFKGVDSLPVWAKAFSVVNTPVAGKVIAQGLGYYRMSSAGGAFGSGTGKFTNQFSAYFPDLDENTGINPDIIDSVISDPTAFAIQLVSPLGFFSEVFSFNNKSGIASKDTGVDFITYCRIIKDNGQINPDENPNMGIDGSGERYVAYGKWRASTQFSSPFPGGTAGNQLFDIVDISEHTESSGRSKYFDFTLTPGPYSEQFTGGRIDGDNPDVQNWHEPIYVINLVKRVADVADTNITNYQYTGHYQKVEALVGISDGTTSQNYLLVDERWEDCIQSINGQVQNDYDSLERFIIVEDTTGLRRRWINVTNKTTPQIDAILFDIQTLGFATVTDSSGSYDVYGVYKSSESVNGTAPEFFLNFTWFNTSFSQDFFIPQEGFRIIVMYDNRIPIRVFGGDTWIGESTWAVKDKLYNNGADPSNGSTDNGDGSGDLFSLNIAFPYRKWRVNPRIFIINSTTGLLANNIQNTDEFKFDNFLGGAPSQVRQLIAMFTAETRINLPLGFNDEVVKESSDQFFPLKNYVMRPYNFDNDFSGTTADIYDRNNIQAAYETDYGNEYLLWGMGGFRFLPQTNIDYSKPDDTKEFTSVPKVGFTEQNLFCTRAHWSEKRPINVQDTPSVRTFPADNIFDISDDTGEIKFAWSATSGNGDNLYVFTDSGIVLLLVDKRIIHEISGNELATVGSDIGAILNAVFQNRQIGMSDEMWRSASEYSNELFWCNYDSAFKFGGQGDPIDIGRRNYHSKIYREYLKILGRGYTDRVTGVFDTLHKEYWVSFRKVGSDGDDPDFSQGKPHSVQESLSVTDVLYDTADNPNDTIVGTTPILPVVITGGIGDIFLGGLNNNLLTGSVSMCSLPDNTENYQVYYRNEDGFQPLVFIQPGECWCFTYIPPSESVYPAWSFKQCNPFGSSPAPFDDFEKPTLIYGNEFEYREVGAWQGDSTYRFDRFLSFENKTYGMRGLETYELDKGRIINGELIQAELINVCSAQRNKDKEFVRIRINSENMPIRVEFFDNFEQVLNNDVQAEIDTVSNPNALRDYNGFEQFVPCKLDPPNDRMQGRSMLFKIIHNADEPFKVVTTELEFKPLK